MSESDVTGSQKDQPKRGRRERLLDTAGAATRKADQFWQSLGHGVERAARSDRTAKAVSDLEQRIATFRRERKIGKGTLRATHVAAYRGFIANGTAHVRIRVFEEPVVPDSAEVIANPKVIRSNLRRFVALALPGVKLKVVFGDESADVESDRQGYATAHIPVPADLEPGWHDYTVVTIPDDPTEQPTFVTGQLIAPDPEAPFLVISDVDDTVLRTGLTEGMVAVRQTLAGSAQTRRAIAGMAALYAGLYRGKGDHPAPAFLYLSTGPWNLYELLTEFLAFRGFPDGVLMLTDWAPQERYIMRSGKQHKRLMLARMFSLYPKTKFVLIGDSGQNDPYVYVEAAKQHPNRVRAIVILDVGDHMAERAAELKEWQTELRKEKVPFYFVRDAAEAAKIFTRLKMVDSDVVSEVALAIAEAQSDPQANHAPRT